MKIDWNKLGEERIKDKTRFYLIISGDKSFKPDDFITMVVNDTVSTVEAQDMVDAFADRLLRTRVSEGFEILVKCGDNAGADTMAANYARSKDYNLQQFHANWDENGSRAGYIRNERLFSSIGLKEHKGGIIFWNGEDPYTKNMIYLGWEFGISLRVYNYVEKRWLKKEEIDTVQNDERVVQLQYGRGF